MGLQRSTGAGAAAHTVPVLAAEAPGRWTPTIFGVVPQGSVRRRARDAVQLALALGVVAGCALLTDGFTARDDRVYRWLAGLTGWVGTAGTWVFLSCRIGAVAVVIVALAWTRNLRLAVTLLAVGVVTAGAAFVLADRLDLDAVRRGAGPDTSSLSASAVGWLAVATAVLLTVAPYLVRPARRAVRSIQLVALAGALVATVGPLPSILAAVGLGWAVSAAVSLLIGTPDATPALSSVTRTLEALGIAIDHLSLADRQTLGETRLLGRGPDGRPASVVVIGRDAADARLFSKITRSVLYRDAGPTPSVSRSAQLEHRAYLLLLAAKEGVPVSEVVLAATGGSEDLAVLALLEPEGTPLADLDERHLTDATLDDVWTQLTRLHAARVAHGQVVPANILVRDDGTTALVDFAHGSTGADAERCALDRVEFLVTTAALVGDDRALDAALRGIGSEGLTELLPLLQTAALSGAARRAVPDAKRRLKGLREDGAARCDCDPPSSPSCAGSRPAAWSWPRPRSWAST